MYTLNFYLLLFRRAQPALSSPKTFMSELTKTSSSDSYFIRETIKNILGLN